MNDNGAGRSAGMAVIRVFVSAYLIYLGITLIRDQMTGNTALSPWLSWGCGVLFVLVGAAYGWSSWKRYRREADAAQDESDGENAEEAGEEPAEQEPTAVQSKGECPLETVHRN